MWISTCPGANVPLSACPIKYRGHWHCNNCFCRCPNTILTTNVDFNFWNVWYISSNTFSQSNATFHNGQQDLMKSCAYGIGIIHKSHNAPFSCPIMHHLAGMGNWPNSQIPHCAFSISNNAPFSRNGGIDLIHKSRNAPLPYTTMHHLE